MQFEGHLDYFRLELSDLSEFSCPQRIGLDGVSHYFPDKVPVIILCAEHRCRHLSAVCEIFSGVFGTLLYSIQDGILSPWVLWELMNDPLPFGSDSALKVGFYLRLLLVEVAPATGEPEGQSEDCDHGVAPEIFAESQDCGE